MRPLGLVVSTLLATTVCFTGPADAQSALAPAPTASPEAEPPAPAPEAPPAAESAPPAPAAPSARVVSPASVAPRVASPFGPPSQLEPTSPVAARPESQPIEGRRIDEGTAAMLSITGTLGSWALIGLAVKGDNATFGWLGAAGLILGPNLGHWYQGKAVTRGTGLRVVGMASTLYGFIRLISCECGGRRSDEVFFFGGALLFLGATVDDIIDAPLRAKKHNQRLEVVGITPMVTDRSAGLALGGRF